MAGVVNMSTEARKKAALILVHYEYGIRLAHKLLKIWNMSFDTDEVQSIVSLSLCKAAKGFDETKGASFKTYYFYFLRGALAKEVSKKIIDKNNLTHDSRMFDGDDNVVPIELAVKETPETLSHKKELIDFCLSNNSGLDELERKVIEEFYLKDVPLTQIAKIVDYSEAHLSRVRKQAISKLSHRISSNRGIKRTISYSTYKGGRGRRTVND